MMGYMYFCESQLNQPSYEVNNLKKLKTRNQNKQPKPLAFDETKFYGNDDQAAKHCYLNAL